MGQPIKVSVTNADDVLLIDADRSITGQDGSAYGSAAEAKADQRFPGVLAARLFASDPAIDHVFIASNQIVCRFSLKTSDSRVMSGIAGCLPSIRNRRQATCRVLLGVG